MTNEEMKMAFAKSGVAEADIEKISEKYDAEKITELVEAANTPEEAFAAIHAVYPELEVAEMQKQCDFILEQVEAAMNGKGQENAEPMELTEDELDMVSGGGFSEWWSKSWKKVAVGAVLTVVGATLTAVGCITSFTPAAPVGVLVGGIGVALLLKTGNELMKEYL